MTPASPDDPLRETLRLIGDLADALGTQVRRLERLNGEPPASLPTDPIKALARESAQVSRRCAELRAAAGEVPGEVVELRSEPTPPPRDHGAPPDAVQTLALEMRMEGRTRDEIEDYLSRSFGRDDAARIADEVFR